MRRCGPPPEFSVQEAQEASEEPRHRIMAEHPHQESASEYDEGDNHPRKLPEHAVAFERLDEQRDATVESFISGCCIELRVAPPSPLPDAPRASSGWIDEPTLANENESIRTRCKDVGGRERNVGFAQGWLPGTTFVDASTCDHRRHLFRQGARCAASYE